MVTSHWQATFTDSAPMFTDLPAQARVVVVGSGVVGASAALWLARAGHAPLLIDRTGPAAGASGRNGGLLVPGTTNGYLETIEYLGHAAARDLWALTVEGVALMRSFIAEEAIACDLAPVGNLGLAITPEQLEEMAATVAQLQADGFAATLLDRAAAEEIADMPLGPEVLGAKFNPLACTLHSAKLVHGLTAAAQRYGARLSRASVQSITRDGDGLKISTDSGSVRADALILAANAWSADLLPELVGLITPVRGQVLTTTPVAPTLRPGFGASLTPTGEYGQQCADGSLLIGGCRAVAAERDVAVRALDASEPVQTALEDALRRLFPAFAHVPIARRWGGTMGFTPDHLPIVDAAAELPGVWYAGGFSGHGMPFAAIVGRALATAATSGALPHQMTPLASRRLNVA
jgi:glycine/D-amino acid oxidase-like deaminating enzyme